MKADQPYNMAALYNGIVFRADSYKTFKDLFNEGMTQRSDQQDTIDGLKKFSNFIGRDAAGHTGSYGISCTTDFFYALNWHRASVYVIDLSSHPFAVDISETVRGREQSPHARQFMQFRKASDQARQFVGSRERDERDDLGDDLQFEINVANRIAPEQIIGCYRGIELVFHKNKRYDPEYGK